MRSEPAACTPPSARSRASGVASGRVAASSAAQAPARSWARARTFGDADRAASAARSERPSTAPRNAVSMPEKRLQSSRGTQSTSAGNVHAIHDGASARSDRSRSTSDATATSAAKIASRSPRKPSSQPGASASG